MKYLVPILAVSLVALSVLVAFRYRESKKAQETAQSATEVQEEVATGDPDTTVDSIIKSAEEEAGSSSAEDDEALDAQQDINEISTMGEVYSDSDY